MGDNGYSATGAFAYDSASVPVSFSDRGAGPTDYLQSFSISFFDPESNLLESGSSIVNGISSDRFFRLDYDTQSRTISSLDADIGGSSYQYFLTNLRSPAGGVVGPGQTTFNLFYRPGGTPILDSAASVQVTSVSESAVPEPAMLPILLGFSVLGGVITIFRRRNSPLQLN